MKDISLNFYDWGHESKIIKLYSDTFSEVFLDSMEEHISRLIRESKNIIMALKEKELIGFGNFVQLHEFPIDKESLENALYWAQHNNKEDRDYLEKYYGECCDKFKRGQVVVEYFENRFTEENKKVLEKDIYFSNLVVHPNFRGQGIGNLLAKKRISIAKKRNAQTIYVDCLENSGAENLYLKLGFNPIMRTGPTYPNGYSSLLMGLELKKQSKPL